MMKKGATFFPGEGGGKPGGLKCEVVLLDGRKVQLNINKKTPGQWVFDHVSRKLGILERDFFGLLFEDEQKCQQWLDMAKPIKKQSKKNQNQLFFCVRYYPLDSMKIGESTKIQLYWQLKRDFVSGRLPCSQDMALQLVAHMAQAFETSHWCKFDLWKDRVKFELDDWTGQYIDYCSQLGMQNKEPFNRESEIASCHQQLRGTSQVDAREGFLKTVNELELYGMVFFEVRYEDRDPYILGLSPLGMALCKDMKIIQFYNWFRVVQVLYRGKRFIVRVSGKKIENDKIQQLKFEVDSSKTCKDLYYTFVDHINFYTKQTTKPKEDDQNGVMSMSTFTRLQTSSSIEELSRQLNKSGSNGKTPEDRLHRSLSLPRKTKNQINVLPVQSLFPTPPPPPPPQNTNTTIKDPVLEALQARKMKTRTGSASPPMDQSGTVSSSEQSSESEANFNFGLTPKTRPSDSQSIDSRNPMHDSLIDLANDLGNDEENGKEKEKEEEEVFVVQELDSSPGQKKHLSSSLPQIAVLNPSSQPISSPKGGTERKKPQATSDEKLQNRMLLRSWVKEQKKKDVANTSSPQKDQSDDFPPVPPTPPSLLPLNTSSSSSSSPLRPYKLKSRFSPHIERPSSSLLPHPTSDPFEIYDVPRPSPAPSPSLHRPHPFSISAYSSLLSVSNIGESTGTMNNDNNNDYDIPRSLIDLYSRSSSPFSTIRSAARQTSYSINSRRSSCSSMSQIAMLKEEYPDYDFPRPCNDPDYDIPKSYHTFTSSIYTSDSRSEDNLSFGPPDKMIANIDADANELQSPSHEEKPTKVKEGEEEECESRKVSLLPKGEKDDTTEESSLIEEVNQQISSLNNSNTPVGTLTNFDEPVFGRRVLRPLAHQPASFPQLKTTEDSGNGSTYDRLSARVALQKLKEDGIVPQDAVEKKGQEMPKVMSERENKMVKGYSSEVALKIQPRLSDLTNQMKLEELLQTSTANQSKSVQGVPFDANFFARQTALEKDRTNQQAQIQGQFWRQPSSRLNKVMHQEKEEEKKPEEVKDSKSIPEPIYQEIPDLRTTVTHRPQKSWSGSRGNMLGNNPPLIDDSNNQSNGSSKHKRAYSGGDVLLIENFQRLPEDEQSVSAEEVTAVNSSSEKEKKLFDRMKWRSFSTKRPMPIDAPPSTNDKESMPNAHTKNQKVAIMPASQPSVSSQGQQHFFPGQLSNFDPSTIGRNNRVMNWMQQSTVWDPAQPVSQDHLMQLGRSMSVSQSVHSQLGHTGLLPQNRGATATLPHPSNNSKYRNHLYEDPEHMMPLLRTQSGGSMAAMLVSQTRLRYPQSKHTAPLATLPYVTRELPDTKSGASVYATDV